MHKPVRPNPQHYFFPEEAGAYAEKLGAYADYLEAQNKKCTSMKIKIEEILAVPYEKISITELKRQILSVVYR